ncbi:MAG: hypothetical protein Kow0075_14580 [Salibacteraceae bacterium]
MSEKYSDKHHLMLLSVALLYFTANSLGLPHGLLYTTLLTPVFYYWLVHHFHVRVVVPFAVTMTPFFIVHALVGVSWFNYALSTGLLFCTLVFALIVHFELKQYDFTLWLFSRLTLWNAALTAVAVIIYFTPWVEWMWTFRDLTITIKDYPRLQLFTYEPSYYSTLLVPLVLFFAVRLMVNAGRWTNNFAHLLLLLISLLLSFSLGVISSLVLAITVFGIANRHRMARFPAMNRFYTFITASGMLSLFLLLVLWPDNPIFNRIADLFSGKDTSGMGRTYEAILLAWKIAAEKSLLFGVGPGQIKIVGEPIIRAYYNYGLDTVPVVRIPNTVGETLATFGLLGVLFRFGVEIWLFAKTRVHENTFRLMMFTYIFIYQFTGSFLTNIAEYVIWVIAFTPCCTYLDFNTSKSQKNTVSV